MRNFTKFLKDFQKIFTRFSRILGKNFTQFLRKFYTLYICDFHIYSWSVTPKFMLFCFVFCPSVQEQIGNLWFRVFTCSYLSSLLNIYLCHWNTVDNLNERFVVAQCKQKWSGYVRMRQKIISKPISLYHSTLHGGKWCTHQWNHIKIIFAGIIRRKYQITKKRRKFLNTFLWKKEYLLLISTCRKSKFLNTWYRVRVAIMTHDHNTHLMLFLKLLVVPAGKWVNL